MLQMLVIEFSNDNISICKTRHAPLACQYPRQVRARAPIMTKLPLFLVLLLPAPLLQAGGHVPQAALAPWWMAGL